MVLSLTLLKILPFWEIPAYFVSPYRPGDSFAPLQTSFPPIKYSKLNIFWGLPNVKNLTITLNEDNWDDWNFEFRANFQ
jgi:hypothetical protein